MQWNVFTHSIILIEQTFYKSCKKLMKRKTTTAKFDKNEIILWPLKCKL